jgi:type VI secretion system secreted protein VgrG
VPYPLPGNKTKAVLRSNSHKSEYRGFNEMSFEDESGLEEIFFHAQRDMNTHVLNDNSKRVEHNSAEFTGNNKSVEVSNNFYQSVGSGYVISVGMQGIPALNGYSAGGIFEPLKSMASSISGSILDHGGIGSMSIFVEGSDAKSVGGSSTEVIAGAKTFTTGGIFDVNANRSVEINAKEDIVTRADENATLFAGKTLEIYVGDSTLVMNADGSIKVTGKKIEFEMETLFKVKAAKIELN